MGLSIASFSKLLVVAVGIATLASPALAAGPSFGPSLDLPGPSMYEQHPHFHRACLSDDDIASELEDAGWRHVEIGGPLGRFRVMAYGSWHRSHTLYRMVVDRCSGNVDRVAAVHPNFPDHPDFPDHRRFPDSSNYPNNADGPDYGGSYQINGY
jgi:hypothetical protein